MPDSITNLLSQLVKGRNTNYTYDVSNQDYAPSLTNVPNALVVKAHGSPRDVDPTGSFSSRDPSVPNVTLADLAKAIGPATNDIKRAFILSCFASGYTYPEVKQHFPNLEQLVAGSTNIATSGTRQRALTAPSLIPYGNQDLKEFSSLFNLTPYSTNPVLQASDWMGTNKFDNVISPITKKEQSNITMLHNLLGSTNSIFSNKNRLGWAQSLTNDPVQPY